MKKSTRKVEAVNIRLTSEQRKAIESAANADGMALSEWIRFICVHEVVLRKPPRRKK